MQVFQYAILIRGSGDRGPHLIGTDTIVALNETQARLLVAQKVPADDILNPGLEVLVKPFS